MLQNSPKMKLLSDLKSAKILDEGERTLLELKDTTESNSIVLLKTCKKELTYFRKVQKVYTHSTIFK